MPGVDIIYVHDHLENNKLFYMDFPAAKIVFEISDRAIDDAAIIRKNEKILSTQTATVRSSAGKLNYQKFKTNFKLLPSAILFDLEINPNATLVVAHHGTRPTMLASSMIHDHVYNEEIDGVKSKYVSPTAYAINIYNRFAQKINISKVVYCVCHSGRNLSRTDLFDQFAPMNSLIDTNDPSLSAGRYCVEDLNESKADFKVVVKKREIGLKGTRDEIVDHFKTSIIPGRPILNNAFFKLDYILERNETDLQKKFIWVQRENEPDLSAFKPIDRFLIRKINPFGELLSKRLLREALKHPNLYEPKRALVDPEDYKEVVGASEVVIKKKPIGVLNAKNFSGPSGIMQRASAMRPKVSNDLPMPVSPKKPSKNLEPKGLPPALVPMKKSPATKPQNGTIVGAASSLPRQQRKPVPGEKTVPNLEHVSKKR